jgi:serine/threonine-protein kinase
MEQESVKIFISHKARDPDLSLARVLYEGLTQIGYEVFFAGASIQSGERWPLRIDRELQQCNCLLLLLSRQSAISEMVIEEVKTVWQRQQQEEPKPLIFPVLLKDDQGKSPEVPYDLRGYIGRIQSQIW